MAVVAGGMERSGENVVASAIDEDWENEDDEGGVDVDPPSMSDIKQETIEKD